MKEEFNKGDILIENPMFCGNSHCTRREDLDLAVYNSQAKNKYESEHFNYNIDILYVSSGHIVRDHDTYSHFWNRANADDIKRFYERLDEMGYFFDEESKEIILKDITEVAELKERLLRYMKDPFNSSSDEKKCITRAIETLL